MTQQNQTDVEIMIGRIPSLKDRCPRTDCGMRMEVSLREDAIIWTCPSKHYSAKEISGETKLAFHEATLSQIRLRR